MVYLDYAANNKVENEVIDLYSKLVRENFANPNSQHKLGFESKKIIDDSTNEIAQLLKVKPDEIIYTSCSTESNNLVIKGICERYKNFGKHILLSSLEHNSSIAAASYMQEQGFEIELIPIDSNGLVDIASLKKMLRPDTILVSVVSVDSEIGLVQPIEEIGKILKDYPNTFFHSDATQSIGKVDIDYSNVDLITISPHKFGGLNDISILIKKSSVSLKPQIHGGRSTTVYRSGTPNMPSIAAAALALKIALKDMTKNNNYVKSLNSKIISHLKKYKNVHINNRENSIPYTINFSIENTKSQDVVKYFNDKDIYISSKTSCCPVETGSKLVYALTKDKSLASSSVRVSLSKYATDEDVNIFLNEFDIFMKGVK